MSYTDTGTVLDLPTSPTLPPAEAPGFMVAKSFFIDKDLPIELLDLNNPNSPTLDQRQVLDIISKQRTDLPDNTLYTISIFSPEGKVVSETTDLLNREKLINQAPKEAFIVINSTPHQELDHWEPLIFKKTAKGDLLAIPLREGVTPITPPEYFSENQPARPTHSKTVSADVTITSTELA